MTLGDENSLDAEVAGSFVPMSVAQPTPDEIDARIERGFESLKLDVLDFFGRQQEIAVQNLRSALQEELASVRGDLRGHANRSDQVLERAVAAASSAERAAADARAAVEQVRRLVDSLPSRT